MTKTTRLSGRLIRTLRAWDPKCDGPLIEIGTLVEAFNMPGTMWHGALADTAADGTRPRMTPGIEGRVYQGTRIGVLARGLHRWIVAQNPHLDEPHVEALVAELAAMADRKRQASREQSARGCRETAAAKREQRAAQPKPAKPNRAAPRVTSDALFKVW